MILVSFDIDGTLECGDPPGPVTLALVRHARQLGFVVGSASDRTLSEQRRLWDTHQLTMDFVSHKHRLDEVRDQFGCRRHVHIGDTIMDEIYALKAGFDFWFADQLPASGSDGWIF